MEIMEIKGKTILITGGTGFIGSHLALDLIHRGARIIVTHKSLDPRSFFMTEKMYIHAIREKVDITNKKACLALDKKYRIDYIYHLAAQTIVTEAFKHPSETLETNIMGTVNILEMARLSKHIKGVIVASSDKAYGKTKRSYTEQSPLQGDHPYDVSKSSCDLIAQMYWKNYKVPVVITRFGNVYGPGDLHTDRLIPSICEAVIKKKPIKLRSDGSYIRDYLFVKDVVAAYVLLLSRIDSIKGEAFNFSSNDTLSVLKVISIIEKVLSKKIPYTILNTAKNEIPYQHLNDTKAKRLGWKNHSTLESRFKETLEWYRVFYRKA